MGKGALELFHSNPPGGLAHGLATSTPLEMGQLFCLVVGAALGIVGHLTSSLVSSYWMPVAPSTLSPDNQKCLPTLLSVLREQGCQV